MGSGLFELRLKSREGIGRIFYCTELGARVGLSLRLDADRWDGVRRVRFLIEGAEV